MRTVLSFVTGIVVVGLCVAVLRQFDWNFVEAFQWVLGLGMMGVNAVADFFQGNPTFQKYVVK
jgi:hypothetical protein